MTLPTAEERAVAGDHPARGARLEYVRMLACERHQMEDGDLCKHCRTRGFVLRARGGYEDELRVLRRQAEQAAEAGPTPEDDDGLEPA